MKRILLIITILVAAASAWLRAQEAAPVTFFPYPQVPDTISTLENRANFYLTHFWDNFNFSRQVSDTEGFHSAFVDFIKMMPYAHRNVVRTSIAGTMNRAQSNVNNFWLFADEAERCLYSDEAYLQSDEAYLYFLNAIVQSSKVKKAEKVRFQEQITKINRNQEGVKALDFQYTGTDGLRHAFYDLPLDTVKHAQTILFFNDPTCDDCRIATLRLSTNASLQQLIDRGVIRFVSITLRDYSPQWAAEAAGLPAGWIAGACTEVEDLYDLRSKPTIYLLDEHLCIISKKITTDQLVDILNR